MSENKKANFAEIMNGSESIAALDRGELNRFSVSRQQIERALDEKNVADLRNFSQYFYQSSGAYRQLVDYYGTLLTFDHVVIPKVKEEEYQDSRFEKSFKRVKEYIKNSSIKESSVDIGRKIVRDGAYYGYERDLNGKITFQHLPAQYCRSRFKVLGVYAVEFDYNFFTQFRGDDLKEILSAYPEEMQLGYEEFLRDRNNKRWQVLDPTYARAHMFDNEVPMLASTFIDLLEYEDAKSQAKIKDELDIYKLIVQRIALDQDSKLTFELPEIKQFHNNLRKAVQNSNIDVITTPFEVDAIDTQDRFQGERDSVDRARETIYSTAGTSAILFNAGSQANSRAIEESIATDEAIMLPLLEQFAQWYKNKLSSIGGRFEYELYFPPITQRNRKKMFEMYDKAATSGHPTKLLAMSSLGIDQIQAEHLLSFENNYLDLITKMVPTKSAHTSSGNDEGGRPTKDTEDLSEEGVNTRDKGDGGEE